MLTLNGAPTFRRTIFGWATLRRMTYRKQGPIIQNCSWTQFTMIPMSLSVCPCQTFPAKSNVCEEGQSLPQMERLKDAPFQDSLLCLPTNIRQGCLSGTNTLAHYLDESRKKVCNICPLECLNLFTFLLLLFHVILPSVTLLNVVAPFKGLKFFLARRYKTF